MVGGGVLGIMSMPFGPIGMVAGGTFGATVGGAIGFWLDKRKVRRRVQQSEEEKNKLKSLVRWAIDHFHEEDEFVALLEMVCLEFKPMGDIAEGSKHARKMLKLLDNWIAEKKVTRNLWVYMDTLLARWREIDRADFLRSMRVFQTLTTMYNHTNRALDEQELQFLHRMQRLLEHDSVKLILANHAQLHPTQNDTRLMESMVYADAHSKKKKPQASREEGGLLSSPKGDGFQRGVSPQNSVVGGLGLELGDSDEDSEVELDLPRRSSSHHTNHSNHTGHGGTPNRPSTRVPLIEGLAPLQNSRSSTSLTNGKESSPRAQSPHDSRNRNSLPPQPIMVLKKPFFKNYKDFMDFNCDIKHQMPITYSEFELVRQKKDEDLKGWDLCVDRKEIRVAKIQNDTGCITLRAWATVPGVDLLVAFYLFTNHHERVKWDKVFAKMDVIGGDVQGSNILYSLMKVPLVTPRDFLQYRRSRIREDGSIEIVLRSAVHQDMPDQKGVIRAESYIAGYVLQQTYEGSTPVLNIFLMSCVDIKGLIPKWIINQTAPRKPAEWVDTLKQAAMDYQKKHPDFRERLKKEMAAYKDPNPFDYEEYYPEEGEDTSGLQRLDQAQDQQVS
jgi:hypothetical protein